MRWKGQDYHFPMHAKHESGERTLNCSWHKVYVLNEASFIAWKSPSVGSLHAGLYTVFENHKKVSFNIEIEASYILRGLKLT